MTAAKPEHFWPVVWGCACVALVAALVLEHQFGKPTAGQGPRAPARVAEAKLLPPFVLTAEQRAGTETLARPLFMPGRRPAPPASAGPSAIKRGQFLLQGTTIVGGLQIALLKEIATGTIHRVEKGGTVLGLTLAEISPEQVVLRSGDDTETLPLVVAKATGSTAAAVEQGPFAPSGYPARNPAAPALPAAAAPVGRVMPATRAPVAPAAAQAQPAVPGLDEPGITPEEMIARRRAARQAQQNQAQQKK